MKRIYYVGLIVTAIVMSACNSDKQNKNNGTTPAKETLSNVIYAGENQPCIDYYDELWCKDPKQLNAEANITIKIRKDAHGNPIIIDKEDK